MKYGISFSLFGLICSWALLVDLALPISCFGTDFVAETIKVSSGVTVMKVGGDYAAYLDDGSVNSVPREMIAREFYRTHADRYNFLLFFSDFDFAMPSGETVAFYLGVKNDVQGIGLGLFDDSTRFGSNGTLQGTIDMGNLANMVVDPLSPDFSFTMGTLSHELMHRWGAYVSYMDPDGIEMHSLLGIDNKHWSYLLDTQGSLMYGNNWHNNGDGTFASFPGRRYFSPLDQYLMGIVDESQVPPMLLIDNPDIEPQQVSREGETISGTARFVTIDQVIAAMGERTPGVVDSQKTFRVGCVYLTRSDSYDPNDLSKIRMVLGQWPLWFSGLTNGKMLIYTDSESVATLPHNPGTSPDSVTPRTIPPEINDGVAWLINHQTENGSWKDTDQTVQRDTAITTSVLAQFSEATSAVESAIPWISNRASLNVDSLSRKIIAFVKNSLDTTALTTNLLELRNNDGGWGDKEIYLSNPYDSAFALSALGASGFSESPILVPCLEYLIGSQNPDGSWSNDSGEGDLVVSAGVLAALAEFQTFDFVDEILAKGLQWVYGRQNTDGGFGLGGSTVYETALVLDCLKKSGVSSEVFRNAIDYIYGLQEEDGSWYGSIYQTALAVHAIWIGSLEPDLAVDAVDVSFAPETVSLLPGEVTISTVIHNLGLTDVSSAKVSLYSESIEEDTKLDEINIAVPGQSTTSVALRFTVKNSNVLHLYLVVDQDNSISEASERNNTLIRFFYPEMTYDLAVNQPLHITPDRLDIFHQTTLSVTVSNYGTLDAYNVPLRYFWEDGNGNIVDLAVLRLDVPSMGVVQHQLDWQAMKAGENMKVSVQVDPYNAFAEESEENNLVSTTVSVNQSSLPNLIIDYHDISVFPFPGREAGTTSISPVIENNGFSPAENFKVQCILVDQQGEETVIGEEAITSLAAGETVTPSIQWHNISVVGEYYLKITLDTDQVVTEIVEADNSAFIQYQVLSLPDFVVSDSSISFIPAVPKDGDMVSIHIMVQNSGEQEGVDVPVVLTENGHQIAEGIISLIEGNSQSEIVLIYDVSDGTGLHDLLVTVDPNRTILEQKTLNNFARRTMSVQNGDLWLSERYISPNGDESQDSTQFSFRLTTPSDVVVAVIDDEGAAVRQFAGPDFENTLGGTVLWDGRGDEGQIVRDGDYSFQVRTLNGSTLAMLPVTVDNNLSPLTDAVGTEFLRQNNMTCGFPYANGIWLPDDSGVVYYVPYYRKTFEYPIGLYLIPPDGQGITRLVPWEWSEEHDRSGMLLYRYEYEDIQVSPDGQHVAFLLKKYAPNILPGGIYGDISKQLWIAEINGRGLDLVISADYYDQNKAKVYPIDPLHFVWSPNGQSLTVVTRDLQTQVLDTFEYQLNTKEYHPLATPDIAEYRIPENTANDYAKWKMSWSPDGTFLVYQGGAQNSVLVTSGAGYANQIDLPFGVQKLEWLNSTVLLAYAYDGIALVTVKGSSLEVTIIDMGASFGEVNELAVNPSGPGFAYVRKNLTVGDPNDWDPEKRGVSYLFVCETTGSCSIITETPESNYYAFDIKDIGWSPDGKRLTYVESIFKDDYGCVADENMVVVETDASNEFIYQVSENRGFHGTYEWPCWDEIASGIPPGAEITEYVDGSLHWLNGGTHLLFENMEDGTKALDIRSGEILLLPIKKTGNDNTIQTRPTPLGRYLSYSIIVPQDSVCFDSSFINDWSMSSLLNLTADLKIFKEDNSLRLKGVASDLHFSHYLLEYADAGQSDIWNLVAPASSRMVLDEDFIHWIPPHEGIFILRLTVTDRAGNTEVDQRTISWGQHTYVTDVYSVGDLFSPNNDGVLESVELHYRILEPIRFEVQVIDESGRVVRTFPKEYLTPPGEDGADFIIWDGRDEIGQVVSDGKYIIRLFDLEFAFQVDTKPPEVVLTLDEEVYNSEKFTLAWSAPLTAEAADTHLNGWILEYGNGDNPQGWYEYSRDQYKNSRDDSVQNVIYHAKLPPPPLIFAVGKSFRLTAWDAAGNVTTQTTNNHIQEVLVLDAWLDEDVSGNLEDPKRWIPVDFRLNELGEIVPNPGIISVEDSRAGIHTIRFNETVRDPLQQLIVQYRIDDGEWFNSTTILPENGTGVIQWDNTDLRHDNVNTVRLKAIDVYGMEYYSNPAIIGSNFALGYGSDPITSECVLRATQLLYEHLDKLSFVLKCDATIDEFQVFDRSAGDVIPSGTFGVTNPILPANNDGSSCEIFMEGTDVFGEVYRTGEYLEGDSPETFHYLNYEKSCRYDELYVNIDYKPARSCNLIAPGQVTIAASMSLSANSFPGVLQSISYYLEKEEFVGTSWADLVLPDDYELLAEQNEYRSVEWNTKKSLECGAWTSAPEIGFRKITEFYFNPITIEVSGKSEGNYQIFALATFIDKKGEVHQHTAVGNLLVDRVLPEVDVIVGDGGSVVCPYPYNESTNDIFTVDVSGDASVDTPANRLVGAGFCYNNGFDQRSVGIDAIDASGRGGPVARKPLAWLTSGQSVRPGGAWYVDGLQEDDVTVMLGASDLVGNYACAFTNVTVDRVVQIDIPTEQKYGSNIKVISPNRDGIADAAFLEYGIGEEALVNISVFSDGIPVRHLVQSNWEPAGTHPISWDGTNDAGEVVLDGQYSIEVTATDGCNNSRSALLASVEVDNTPPAVIISTPQPGEPLELIVRIEGTADDPHFQEYTVEIDGNEGRQQLITSYRPGFGLLATWNIFGRKGYYTIFLKASDSVGNTAMTTTVLNMADRIPSPDLLADLSAEPSLFSPNGDAKLDSTEIIYTPSDQVQEPVNAVLSIMKQGVEREFIFADIPPGVPQKVLWDGKNVSGSVVADGTYSIQLNVSLVSNPSISQTEVITVDVDATAPLINFSDPENLHYYKNNSVAIAGSIVDGHLSSFEITVEDPSGSVNQVASGSQSMQDHQFNTLTNLADGAYRLTVSAADSILNENHLDIPFIIDTTPPALQLDSPLSGEVYGGVDNGTISVSGSIEEVNVEKWEIRYGAGLSPLTWEVLSSDTVLPADGIIGYEWNVGPAANLQDGIYTISFFALDKAGWPSEITRQITIDNTPPVVTISSPELYVTENGPIKGTATDANLTEFTLLLAGGSCADSLGWQPIMAGTKNVQEGLLTHFSLPADGGYCLKLEAIDGSGARSSVLHEIIVDTTPPISPTLSGERVDQSTVQLLWEGNSETDLAGYNLYRDGQLVNDILLTENEYIDGGLKDGTYSWTVKAIDKAGWESPNSNEITIRVDIVPPKVGIRFPVDAAFVSNLVKITGTAYSADDFKEYRVFIASAQYPDQWSLIRKSPLAISYGNLADWDTFSLSEGNYLIKLEAEDLNGNIGTEQVEVTVDNTPPGKPNLLSVIQPDSQLSDTEIEWSPNQEDDLAGYLLYRNYDLANASALVTGNLTPYLINSLTYTDSSLPDGTFSYFVVAMDQAGNLSDQSNSISIDIDTHPPQAVLTEPVTGINFDQSILLKAESQDLDVASVQFQYRSQTDPVWLDLGTPVTSLPFSKVLNPLDLGFDYGSYQLRAVATDQGGRTDAAPQEITVNFTDLSPPAAPSGLVATVRGDEITLSWDANQEYDLAGYVIYQTNSGNHTLVATVPPSTTSFSFVGQADGQYQFAITALDTGDNESPESTVFPLVYTPLLAQPEFLYAEPSILVSGSECQPNDDVSLLREAPGGPEVLGVARAASDGTFQLDIALVDGVNRIFARSGNGNDFSNPSPVITAVLDLPPDPPTGLTATVSGPDVQLDWNPNAESDLVGYIFYRDGQVLNAAVPITDGTTSDTPVTGMSEYAFDEDRDTYWSGSFSQFNGESAVWQVNFPASHLLNSIELDWESIDSSAGSFIVERWDGWEWTALTEVSGNVSAQNTFVISPAVPVEGLRIIMRTGQNATVDQAEVHIAEIRFIELQPIIDTSYIDQGLANGTYSYSITAVDAFLQESLPSNVVDAVIDTMLLPPPVLKPVVALPEGAGLTVCWSEVPGAVGYSVYRRSSGDGIYQTVAASPRTGLCLDDLRLTGGTPYYYVATSVDGYGNESEYSAEVSGIPFSPLLQTPIIQQPATATGEVTATCPRLTISGICGEGDTVELLRDGVVIGTTQSTSGTSSNEILSGIPELIGLTVEYAIGSPNGKYVVINYVDDNDLLVAAAYDLTTRVFTAINLPGVNGNYFVNWSPDGLKAIFECIDINDSSNYYVYDTSTLATIPIGVDGDIISFDSLEHWSGDGGKLAFDYRDDNDVSWVAVLDIGTGDTHQVVIDKSVEAWVDGWSPDDRFVTVSYYDTDDISHVGLYDVNDRSFRVVSRSDAWESWPNEWSSDGSHLAISSSIDAVFITIYDVTTGNLTTIVTPDSYDNWFDGWSPDGTKIVYCADIADFGWQLSIYDRGSGEIRSPVDFEVNFDAAVWFPDSSGFIIPAETALNPSFSFYRLDLAVGELVPLNTSDAGTDFFLTPDARFLSYHPDSDWDSTNIYDLSTKTEVATLKSGEESFIGWSTAGDSYISLREADDPQSLWLNSVANSIDHQQIGQGNPEIINVRSHSGGSISYFDGTEFHLVNSGGTSAFTFADIALSTGEHVFAVRATDGAGNFSSESPAISVTADPSIFEGPPSPDPLTITANSEGMGLTVCWTAVDGATGYKLYKRSSVGNTFVTLNASPLTNTCYFDSELIEGEEYSYVATSIDGCGLESEFSGETTAIAENYTLSRPVILQPVGAGATITSADSLVDISGRSDPGVSVTLSRNGKEIETVVSSSELATTPLLGAIPELAGLAIEDVYASPDGRGMLVEYYDQNGDADRAYYDKTTREFVPIGLPGVNGNDFSTWSPDGTKIIFECIDQYDQSHYYVYGLAGGNLYQIIIDGDLDDDLESWSADSSKLAIQYFDGSGVLSLAVFDFSTGETDAIVVPSCLEVWNGYWSPTDSQLMIEYRDEGDALRLALYDCDQQQLQLVIVQDSDEEWASEWSPAGRYFAFVASGNYQEKLKLYDAAAGVVLSVDSPGEYDWFGAWAPDGTKFVFNSDIPGWGVQLTLMGLDTWVCSQLGDDEVEFVNIAWKPDGSGLVFSMYGPYGAIPYAEMDLVTGSIKNINTSAASYAFELSPNGRFLLYRATNNGKYIYDLINDVETEVQAPTYQFLQGWAGDGQYLVTLQTYNIQPEVLLIPTDNPYDRIWVGTGNPWIERVTIASNGSLYFFDGSEFQEVSLPGTFVFPDISLEYGANIFTAKATNDVGESSADSLPVTVIYDSGSLPDLAIDSNDIYLYPLAPLVGDPVTIYAEVHNDNPVILTNVDADLYIQDALGGFEWLASQHFSVFNPGESVWLNASWDTTGRTGMNTIYVVLDGDDTIMEADESNNMAAKSFMVVEDQGPALTATLDRTSYPANDTLALDVTISNSGPTATFRVAPVVENAAGAVVAQLTEINVDLTYGAIKTQALSWPVGATMNGAYRVRVELVDTAGNNLAEQILPFTILPDIRVAAKLSTTTIHYGPNKDVAFSSQVDFLGVNALMPLMDVHLAVSSDQGEVYTADHQLSGLFHLSSMVFADQWFTGISAPGNYHAVMTVFHQGEVMVTAETDIVIDPATTYTGSLHLASVVIPDGTPVDVEYALQSSGNAAGGEQSLRVELRDAGGETVLSSYTTTVDLAANDAMTAITGFAAEFLHPGVFKVMLIHDSDTGPVSLADATFTVVDIAPPQITISSPLDGAIIIRSPDLTVTVTDDSSGVATVEYLIDAGSWQPMPVVDPSTSRYSVKWTVGEADEGSHLISFRATDRVGNMAQPVTSSFTVTPLVEMVGNIDTDRIAINESLTGNIRVSNQGWAKTLSLSIQVEDVSGMVIHEEPDQALLLLDDAIAEIPLSWKVGTTAAGPYRLQLLLHRASEILAEQTLDFEILPGVVLNATLTTDQPSYGMAEDVTFSGLVASQGNFSLPEVTTRLTIIDNTAVTVATMEQAILDLAPSSEKPATFLWNTERFPAGIYQATLEIVAAGEIKAVSTVSLTIEPVVDITGTLSLASPEVSLGDSLPIDLKVMNSGNTLAQSLPLQLTIADPFGAMVASYDWTPDLPIDAPFNQSITFETSNVALGRYQVSLAHDQGGTLTTLATAEFTVIDALPPTLTVLAPADGSFFDGPFALIAQAEDLESGIETVDYQVDGASWLPLTLQVPSTDRYGATWVPVVADEGDHLITFRAVDRAGNSTIAPPVAITIELCRPYMELSGTLDYRPQPLYRGQEVGFPFSLINTCAKSLAGLTVTLTISDPATGGVLDEQITTVNIQPESEMPGEFQLPTLGLADQVYQASLEVSLADELPRILASRDFSVLKPLLVSLGRDDRVNILVWLNDACGLSNGESDQNQDNHTKGETARSGSYDHERGNIPDCLDPLVVKAMLADSAHAVFLTNDRTEFESELRNPQYTDFLILGDHLPLTDHLNDELREKIHSGAGLVSSNWLPTEPADTLVEALLGVKGEGSYPASDSLTVRIDDNPAVTSGDLTGGTDNRKVEIAGDTMVAGWFVKTTCVPAPDDDGGHDSDDDHAGSGEAGTHGDDDDHSTTDDDHSTTDDDHDSADVEYGEPTGDGSNGTNGDQAVDSHGGTGGEASGAHDDSHGSGAEQTDAANDQSDDDHGAIGGEDDGDQNDSHGTGDDHSDDGHNASGDSDSDSQDHEADNGSDPHEAKDGDDQGDSDNDHADKKSMNVTNAQERKISPMVVRKGITITLSRDSHGGGDSKDDDTPATCIEREEILTPAVVLHDYGLGRTLYYAFDFSNPVASDSTRIASLLAESLGYVHVLPPTTAPVPLTPAPVRWEITSPGIGFDLSLVTLFPEGLGLHDPVTGGLSTDTWPTTAGVAAGSTTFVPFTILPPEGSGSYRLELQSSTLAEGLFLQQDGFDFTIANDRNDLIDQALVTLGDLPVSRQERATVKAIKQNLETLRDRLIRCLPDIEQNIHDLNRAISDLRSLEAIDVLNLRLQLDELLKVEESRWYFYTGTTNCGGKDDHDDKKNPDDDGSSHKSD
ncbi:MAG: hypothetical protein KJ950_14110 [Proteobacteria bacterium]|nr:hypothetical protein [Pseudomonadota bacterium]MBU1686675.1 hypothetical protein [Pseudomonadota bacterium]